MHKDYSSLSYNDSLSLSCRDEPELGSMVDMSSSSCNDCNESVNKIPSKKQSTIGLITGETILEWGRRMVDEPVVNGLSIVFLFDDCRYWRMNAWSVHVSHQLGWKSHDALILCCGIGSRLFDPGFPKRCDPESDAYLMNRDVFGGGWVDISDILTSIEMSDEYKVNEWWIWDTNGMNYGIRIDKWWIDNDRWDALITCRTLVVRTQGKIGVRSRDQLHCKGQRKLALQLCISKKCQRHKK